MASARIAIPEEAFEDRLGCSPDDCAEVYPVLVAL